jgi:transcriptional regulator with XRE-family HTH domain
MTEVLGHQIRVLRGARGWTQEDLAGVSGVSTRTIQRIESGTTNASAATKASLAAFDIDVCVLQMGVTFEGLLASATQPQLSLSKQGNETDNHD